MTLHGVLSLLLGIPGGAALLARISRGPCDAERPHPQPVIFAAAALFVSEGGL